MNPHQKLLEKTLEVIGDEKWIEVSHEVPFGFHEVSEPDRINISVDDFLENLPDIDNYKTCVFHILLGCGVDKQKLIKAINRSTRLFDRVFILEHNKSSLDWSTGRDSLPAARADHFIENCVNGEEFLELCENHSWRHRQTIYVDGWQDDKRNMIIELEGKLLRYIDPFTPIESHQISYKDLRDVYLGNADRVSLLENIQNKIKERKKSVSNQTKLYASCGGFFSLNIISFLTDTPIKNVTFYDINPYTVKFGHSVIRIIDSSISLKNFSNEDRAEICERNLNNYHKDVLPLFKLILHSTYTSKKLNVNGLMNVGGASEGCVQLKYGGNEYINNNSLDVGYGWLESEESFQQVKKFLSKADIEFLHADIDEIDYTKNDILLASNILEFKGKIPKDYNCTVIEGNR